MIDDTDESEAPSPAIRTRAEIRRPSDIRVDLRLMPCAQIRDLGVLAAQLLTQLGFQRRIAAGSPQAAEQPTDQPAEGQTVQFLSIIPQPDPYLRPKNRDIDQVRD